MKMMFDGREIETGGGGLTQEEADGRYVKQGENLAESIEVSVVDPSTPPDVLEYAPVSRLELGLNGVVLSTVDRGGGYTAEIVTLADHNNGDSSARIFAGLRDMEDGTEDGAEILLWNGVSVNIHGKEAISANTNGEVIIPVCVYPETDTMPATKGYVDTAVSEAKDGGVTSFKGRTGAVTPQSGDYTAAQVGAYTQAQCISAATRTLLGLGSAAAPDAALRRLALGRESTFQKLIMGRLF